MKKLLALTALVAGTLFVVSCGDDDGDAVSFDQPSVTAGSVGDQAFGATDGTVSFTITLDADLSAAADWTLTSTGIAGATIGGETSGTISASGSVDVAIDAGTTPGGATITLTVTNPSQDPAGLSANATASFNVLPEGDEPAAISMIPSTATIAFGSDLADVPYQVDAADGLATFTVSVNGAEAVDFSAVTGDDLSANPTSISGNFTVDFETLQALGANVGANSLEFVAEDVDGSSDGFTHTLTIEAPATVVVDGNITGTVSWTSENVYELATRVTVVSGATLNIEAGTVIKGRAGQGESSTALLVARGGSINAAGTASAPIIFTSVSDQLVPGQLVSPNLEADVTGLWGGVILLGDDYISVSGSTENQVDGIPPSDTNGLYGGTNADHNIGTFTYVSIRYAGTDIGDGDEINGLTLGGVGASSTVNWIEVVANKDDGVEWFGGSVSSNGILIWNNGDDALDTDQAWNGDVTEFIIVNPGKSGFELDGPEGSYYNTTKPNFSFSNGTVYNPAAADFTIDFDANTNTEMSNIYFYGFPETSPATVAEYAEMLAGEIVTGVASTSSVSGFQYTLNASADYAAADIFVGIPAAQLTEVAENANTVGPDATDFGWTFAGASGALSSIGL